MYIPVSCGMKDCSHTFKQLLKFDEQGGKQSQGNTSICILNLPEYHKKGLHHLAVMSLQQDRETNGVIMLCQYRLLLAQGLVTTTFSQSRRTVLLLSLQSNLFLLSGASYFLHQGIHILVFFKSLENLLQPSPPMFSFQRLFWQQRAECQKHSIAKIALKSLFLSVGVYTDCKRSLVPLKSAKQLVRDDTRLLPAGSLAQNK